MYSTDLTDSQWEVIEDILNDQRKRKHNLRDIINGIFYLQKTGCQWRMIPKEYPPYESCYYYFRKWKNTSVWKMINKCLVELYRIKQGKSSSPSVGIIDSQSVKSSEWGVPDKGVDGYKKIKGRKRHIVVDSLGNLLAVKVHAANRHDSKGALKLLEDLFSQAYNRLFKIIGDNAYKGELISICALLYGWIMEVVTIQEIDKKKNEFQVLPQRWKVERTFSWFNWDRRLSKDYECNTDSAEAMVYISNIHRLIRKF